MNLIRLYLMCGSLSALVLILPTLCVLWMNQHGIHPLGTLLFRFRQLPWYGRMLVTVFALTFILYGSTKTNAVGGVEGTAPPLGGKGRGAGRAPYGLGQTVISDGIAHWRLVELNTNATFDYAMPSNAACHAPWTLRGAAEDWTRVELGSENGELGMADWRFPFGANDLSAVQVFTDGTIRPKLHSLSNQIVAVGSPMSAIPGVSRFWYAVGTNDSRVLTWENFVLGRVPVGGDGASIFAQIELFRSGDYIVRSNGVERVFRFVDPFEWSDGEWNQSDAERAAIDAAVGTGLENGYYKLTVTVPPSVGRRTLITVGDRRLAVDRPGEYAFLLAKGEEYALSLEPFSSDIAFTAVDDITPPMMLMGFAGESNDHLGHWTVDGGELQLVYPTFASAGRIWWMPKFCGSPDVAHLGPYSGAKTFTAQLSDYRYAEAVAYHWTCDDENVVIVSPNSRETTITFATMPSWRAATLTVTATVGTNELRSALAGFTYGTNDTPQVHFSFSVPDAVLLNSNNVDNAKLRKMSLSFSSDVETNGSIRLSCASGADRISVWGFSNRTSRVSLPQVWEAADFAGFEAFVEGVATSESVDDVRLKAEFISGPDKPLEQGKDLTVVEVGEASLPGAPDDGLVVTRGSSVLLKVDCLPAGAESFVATLWESRRLRLDLTTYDDWTYATSASGDNEATYAPSEGGIYQLRVKIGVGGDGVDERYFLWSNTEPINIGFKRKGDLKSFGVVSHVWQKTLRDCACAFFGSKDYLNTSALSAQYGFPEYGAGDNSFKCNIFVAHRIVQVGLSCPKIHGIPRKYPPLANDWGEAGMSLENWSPLLQDSYPEPGYVIAEPSGNSGPHGHVAILDFDGCGISAGTMMVNRKFVPRTATFLMRKYEE